MDKVVFSGTLNNGLEVSIWWIPDDAVYFIEVCIPDDPYNDSMDGHIKEAKGVLSYLSELQRYKQKD